MSLVSLSLTPPLLQALLPQDVIVVVAVMMEKIRKRPDSASSPPVFLPLRCCDFVRASGAMTPTPTPTPTPTNTFCAATASCMRDAAAAVPCFFRMHAREKIMRGITRKLAFFDQAISPLPSPPPYHHTPPVFERRELFIVVDTSYNHTCPNKPF